MDLIHVWHGDRKLSRILHGAVPSPPQYITFMSRSKIFYVKFLQEDNHKFEYKVAATPSASVPVATLPRPGITDYRIAEKRKFSTINQLVQH